MQGKVALVTGGNSGIGLELCKGLASAGAHVVMVSRDPARGEAALEIVRQATGSDSLELMQCDLADFEDIHRFAAEFTAEHDRLHLLLNNAGAIIGERRLTVQGHEVTFGVNHLAPFLLTHLLLPTLKASAPSRVISTASEASRLGHIDFDDLDFEKRPYRQMRAYCDSKLANILFTRVLKRRLVGTGVAAHCFHPGPVRTRFGEESRSLIGLVIKLGRPFMISPKKGADTGVWLATSDLDDLEKGDYWARRRPLRGIKEARSREVAERLWDVSERLVGLDPGSF